MNAETQPATRRRKTSEEKNAEARASLEPLAPGERPRAVTVAAVVAAMLAISNVVAYFAGAKPDVADSGDVIAQLVVATGILALCAIGMWLAKYWAVLGFQTLLALQMLVSVLALTRADSLPAVAIWLALLAGGGVLFWHLIRAMARIQMPAPPETAALREAREKLAAARAEQSGGIPGDADE